MRTFIAIELPEPILAAIAMLSDRLRASRARVTWVKPENMHLTLRFLGEVDDENIKRITTILSDAYRGVTPFTVSVRGTGAFPNERRPNVIWAGVESAGSGLETAHMAAESAARAIGLPPEDRAFHPHLTLVRIKEWREAPPVIDCLERESDFNAGDFTVKDVSLFSSRLTPHGPVYQRLQEFIF
jgi:2'-5' RNA ligase